jgi:hypothetical protein
VVAAECLVFGVWCLVFRTRKTLSFPITDHNPPSGIGSSNQLQRKRTE